VQSADKIQKVAERRKKIAHGGTVGERAELNQAPDGAKEFVVVGFLSPLPGLGWFG
jgi:hypothetical protein